MLRLRDGSDRAHDRARKPHRTMLIGSDKVIGLDRPTRFRQARPTKAPLVEPVETTKP